MQMEKQGKNKNLIILILVIIILVMTTLLMKVLIPTSTTYDAEGVALTVRTTQDGFSKEGFIITKGEFADHVELAIREKDSNVVTKLVYDSEGNLTSAEVMDMTEVAAEADAKAEEALKKAAEEEQNGN